MTIGLSAGILRVLGATTSPTARSLGIPVRPIGPGHWQVPEKNYTAHSNLADALARHGRSLHSSVHFEAAENHSIPTRRHKS